VKLLKKLFWRIIFPVALALVSAVVELLSKPWGRGLELPHNWLGYSIALLYLVIPLVFFALALRNALRWAKESEGFELRLKDADQFEKERRRRSSWLER